MGKKGFFTDCKGNKSLTRLLIFISSIIGYLMLAAGVILITLKIDKADVVILAGAGLVYGGNMSKKYQQETEYRRNIYDQTSQLQ